MVGVAVGPESSSVTIFGHGITVDEEFELESGIWVSPTVPQLDLDKTVKGCAHFSDYAAALNGNEIATFSIKVSHPEGGEALTVKAWNSLWLFHLLSVACHSPCLSLYTECDSKQPLFSAAAPSPFIRPFEHIYAATAEQLKWARDYSEAFDALIKVSEFSAAMRCYGNAHLLPEHEVRIMLLWAGIEGLLSVDAELSRRLALYSALMMEGSANEKAAYFEEVKRAYNVRSRAVHGSGLNKKALQDGYLTAGRILIRLIARCVELGRVPSPSELDRLAVSGSIQP